MERPTLQPGGALRPVQPGLSARGADVVAEMNALGIVIDVAHAGRATTLAVCGGIAAPVICSHTSARLLAAVCR